ncbi:MAG: hypothetical protein QOF84_2658, partial [Streptomyces sp.]|nr:hypothetical protein [Streptomyces sp.]
MTTSPGSDEGQRVICFPLEERLAQKLATQPVSVSPGEQAQLISEVQERFKEVSPHVLAELLTEIRSRSPHSDLESTAPVIAPLNPGTAAERSPSAPGLPRADVASPVTDQDRIANAFHIWEAPLADDAGRLERTLLDAGPGASAHTVSVGGDGMPAVSYAINDGRHVRWVDAGTGELTGPPLDDGRVASIALDAAGVVLNPPETLLALGESTVRLPGLRPGPEVLRALERTSAAEGSAEAQLERGGPGQHHAAATSPIATDGSSDAARPAVAAAGDREPLRPVLPQAFFDAPMRVSPVPTMDVGDGLESGPESGPESRVVAWSPAMEALAGAALAKMLGDHPVPENGSFATLRDAFHDLPEAVRKAPVHAVAQKVAERFLGSYNGLPGGAPASGWSYPAGGSSAAGWNAAGWINVSGGSSATGNASGQRPSLLPLFDPAPRRDFHENAQRLYHRVDRIADLKNDPQFMSALDAFMQNVNQNIWGVTTSVNEEAIGDLFSKLHRIRGTEVAYKWYVDHQNLGNFAYERDQKAADSVHQGHVWSKLNVWKSARREGILLETTIGGYLFNELKALGY